MAAEQETSPTPSLKETLPDLSLQYSVKKYLGSGRNDSGYLVTDQDGQEFVALTPSLYPTPEQNWPSTVRKFRKTALLDKMGLSEHITHDLHHGTLPLWQSDSRDLAVITEYAGEPITTADSATSLQKLAILEQIWHVTQTIHHHGYAIKDFKLDHWCYQVDTEGNPQVKLIDYTQISQVPEDSIAKNQNDHRIGDLLSLKFTISKLFPWFSSTPLPGGTPYSRHHEQFQADLKRLQSENKSLSPTTKRLKTFMRKLREMKSRI